MKFFRKHWFTIFCPLGILMNIPGTLQGNILSAFLLGVMITSFLNHISELKQMKTWHRVRNEAEQHLKEAKDSYLRATESRKQTLKLMEDFRKTFGLGNN